MTDLVSIIIPIHNLENYLPQTLNSVVSQTYEKLEILLVDDHSTDNSQKVMAEFAKKDSRIQIFQLPTHQGVSVARNLGIKKARGAWISFVDGDDLIASTFIETLVNQTDEETALSAVGYGWGYRARNNQKKSQSLTRKEIFPAINRYGDPIGGYVWNKLFRRSALLEKEILFDEKIALAEDLWFTAEYIAYAPQEKFSFDPQILYEKINRSDSTIHSASRDMRQKEQIIRRQIDKLAQKLA